MPLTWPPVTPASPQAHKVSPAFAQSALATVIVLGWAAMAQSDGPQVAILGGIADGTPPQPELPKASPAFTVEHAREYRLGDHKVILRRVANPDSLRETTAPEVVAATGSALAPADAQVSASMPADEQPAIPIRVSASVWEHRMTLVRWWYGEQEFHAWSNVDFNYLSGFGEFEHGGTRYTLLMGLGDVTPDEARREGEFREPPNLGVDYPAYTLIQGDAACEEGLRLMDALHDLFAAEQDRLIAAYEGRERALREQEAYRKAHPPVRADTVIHYWPRHGSRSLNGNPEKVKEGAR